jgi:hypothetical protein
VEVAEEGMAELDAQTTPKNQLLEQTGWVAVVAVVGIQLPPTGQVKMVEVVLLLSQMEIIIFHLLK